MQKRKIETGKRRKLRAGGGKTEISKEAVPYVHRYVSYGDAS